MKLKHCTGATQCQYNKYMIIKWWWLYDQKYNWYQSCKYNAQQIMNITKIQDKSDCWNLIIVFKI